jgi:hypothetical protein
VQKKLSKKDVVAISLNLDCGVESPLTEKLKKEVLDKLIELNMHCENVMSSATFDEVAEKLEFPYLPAALVYSRDGKLLKRFEGEFTYADDVIPFVAQTVKESK